MIAFAVITLSTLTLTGIAVMLYALNHAVDGYEDERGFHQGFEQAPRRPVYAAAYVEADDEIEESWVEGVRISG